MLSTLSTYPHKIGTKPEVENQII